MDRTIGITSARIDQLFNDKDLFLAIKQSGFDYVDYYISRYATSSPHFLEKECDLIAYFTDLKNYADQIGLKIHQTHAPYPTQPHNGKDSQSMFKSMQDAIHASAILGAKYVIMHPQRSMLDQNHKLYDSLIQKDVDFYGSLLPTLEKHNMTLAIENMYGRSKNNQIVHCTMSIAEHILKALELLNNNHYCACLDIGHAHILHEDSGVSFIKALGANLKVIHLHDNFRTEDDHLAPTLGSINWQEVITTLQSINYSGVCNLEAHGSSRAKTQDQIKANLQSIHKIITKLQIDSNY